jgi:hypothetical protein
MEFPILPLGQKPDYYYLDGGYIVAVVITQELLRFYKWDKIADTYNLYWSKERAYIEMQEKK